MIPSEMWMRENPCPSEGEGLKKFSVDVLEKVLGFIPQPKGEEVNLYVQAILDGDWDYSQLTRQAKGFVDLRGSLIIPQGILTRPFAVTSNSVVLDIYRTYTGGLIAFNEQISSRDDSSQDKKEDADIESPPRLLLENAVWEDYRNNCQINLTAYGVRIAKTHMVGYPTAYSVRMPNQHLERYPQQDIFPRYVDDVLSEVSRAGLLYEKTLKNFSG